ncbi:MAG: GNAT family N-acetyltransferase [Polaromonas sp.]|nr:GNAT family N-acetyltransferase [Polaromonas sp.]
MHHASPLGIELREAGSSGDYAHARTLFAAYAASVGRPDCFPGFEQELLQLPHMYGPPHGGLFLAFKDGAAAGCCAFRARSDTDHTNACEMKRLFVLPDFRRLGLGHLLVTATLDAARISGYSCMLLDTLSEMESARALYEEMGFAAVPPYAQSPIPGAHHLKVDL